MSETPTPDDSPQASGRPGLGLQGKFVLLLIATVAMAVIPTAISSYEHLKGVTERLLQTQGEAHAHTLEGLLLDGSFETWKERGERMLPHFTGVDAVAFLSVRAGDGREVTSSFASGSDQALLRQDVLGRIAHPDYIWNNEATTRLEAGGRTLLILRRSVYADVLVHEPDAGPDDPGRRLRQKKGEIWVGLDLSLFTEELARPFDRSLLTTILIALVVIAVALWLYHREFLRPIRRLLFGAQRLGSGDLEYQVSVDTSDELGELAQAFNGLSTAIRHRLREQRDLVSQVERIVRRLGSSTGAILSVVSQQVSGAGQQASSVHHVSSTAEEIAASSRSVAETAKTMGTAASDTVNACSHGKSEVEEAISGIRAARETVTGIASSMERLGADSRKIGEILKLIEGISEQTNLLALNAAIEAAGAGEAGQRFAIVATEVKRLATRTNESTKEIRDLISTIQNSTNKAIMLTEEGTRSVAEGYDRVHRVGDSIQDIRESVERTSLAADAILASSQEQVTATEQMAESMNEIRKVADAILENSSVTEASVEEINQICTQLKALFESAISH